MQVKLLIDCDGPDPDNPRRSTPRPAGTVIDHPDAWLLCLPERIPVMRGNRLTGKFVDGQVRAEPADDEARARLADA